jgi:hypothetical protein
MLHVKQKDNDWRSSFAGRAMSVRQEFDESERMRMREALRAYAREHRIGTGKLSLRIAQATKRDPELIPGKTLQRFLTDAHRTEDWFLVPVAMFCATLVREDAQEAFGRAAASFFTPKIPAEGSGTVRGTFAVWGAGRTRQGMRLYDRKKDGYVDLMGTLLIDGVAAPGVIKARETIGAGEDGRAVAGGLRHVFEGVVVGVDLPAMVLLRSTLTGYPKSYWIYRDDERYLFGLVSKRVFDEDAASRGLGVMAEQIQFVRQTEQGAQ